VKVLTDTTIWSHVLRRPNRPVDGAVAMKLAALIDDGLIAIIGPIRQELLSGIREAAQFEQVREYMRGFLDMEITVDDYETAATFYNRCREKGIQGSHTDFLMCAVAVRHDCSIFTTDGDFSHYAKILPITLYT
jgi:predicted nucleic acid-binding protein